MTRKVAGGAGSRSSGRMSLRTAILIGPGGLLIAAVLAHALGLTNGRPLSPAEVARRAMAMPLCSEPPAATNRYITDQGWKDFIGAGWCPKHATGQPTSGRLVVTKTTNTYGTQAFVEGELFLGGKKVRVNIELDPFGGRSATWFVNAFVPLPCQLITGPGHCDPPELTPVGR